MNIKQLFPLKNQAELCFFSSVAVLLSMPSYGFSTAHVILAILSVISFFCVKDSIVVRALCVSVCLNSTYSVLDLYYGNIINALILLVIVVGPIVYAIIKAGEVSTRVFLGIIILTILPRMWNGYSYSFDTNTLLCLSFYLLIISLIFLFLSSALDTTDIITRYISLGAAIASAFILFVAVIGIIYEFCDQPKSGKFEYGIISEYDFTPEEYPLYAACRNIFSFSTNWVFLAGIIMASYFGYLLKRSKMALSGVCIPAILSMIGFGVMYGANTMFAHYRGFGLWNEADDVVLLYFAEYVVLTYSLYKFYKKL